MIFRESGKKSEEYPTLAVIGLDGWIGACGGLEEIRDRLYFGHADVAADPDLAEAKKVIDTQEISFARYGFAYVDQMDTTPEQRIGLLIGLRALRHAGIDLAALKKQRIAVLYASASGKQPITYRFDFDRLEDHVKEPVNALERILKLSGITGGIYDLSDFVSPLTAGIMLTEKLLLSHKADLTVLVNIGLQATYSIRRGQYQDAADAAAAVVLQTKQQARRAGRRMYAVLQGASVSNSGVSNAGWLDPRAALTKNLQDALEVSSILPAEIGAIELSHFHSVDSCQTAIQSLQSAFQNTRASKTRTCAMGSAASAFGDLGNAAEMVSLVKSILQLSQQMICASRLPSNQHITATLQQSSFYQPDQSRTWFTRKQQPLRYQCLFLLQSQGSCTHIILGEAEPGGGSEESRVVRVESFLFPICGDTENELMQQLSFLQVSLLKSQDLAQLQQFWIRKWEKRQEPRYTAVFLGSTAADVLREVQFGEQGLPKAIAKGGEWQTPAGSYFSATPLGPQGKVAFVYPGAFNSQINSGKDLFYSFPALSRLCEPLSTFIGELLYEDSLYPRVNEPLSDHLRESLNQTLVNDPLLMLSSGTALAVLYTTVLRDIFQLQAQITFGYSLGENSMMFASGVWANGDAALERLKNSPLFQERISGRQSAIREFWRQQGADCAEEKVWANYILMGDADALRETIEQTPRVYLTHINTPRQVVIGGYPQDCEAFIAEHKLNSLRAPFDHALHCEPIHSERQEFAYLHQWPIARQPELELYTAATYAKTQMDTDLIAANIAETLTTPLDFPRLVQTVYDEGARIFIETGAGSNCSKWVDQILKREAHVSMAINQHGISDSQSVLRVLARCVSHRVPLTLQPLLLHQTQEQLQLVRG